MDFLDQICPRRVFLLGNCIRPISWVKLSNEEETLYIYKSFVTDEAIDAINISLYQSNWKEILKCENVNEAYTTFLDKFYQLYDNFSLIKKIKIKFNSLKSPCITLRIKQTAKSKQRLYNKFLKNRSAKNEREYKGYKILFKTIKKLSKKLYFSNLIYRYKTNIKEN